VPRPVRQPCHQPLEDVGAGHLQQFRRADMPAAADQRQPAAGLRAMPAAVARPSAALCPMSAMLEFLPLPGG